MRNSLSPHSVAMVAVACLLSTFVLPGCSHHPQSDAAVQKRLVGTWRYHESLGARIETRADLVFTVTSDGGYSSQVKNPEAHTLGGTAQVKDGLLVVTVTNRDNAAAPPGLVDRETIVRFDDKELVVRSEGSMVENVFQRDTL